MVSLRSTILLLTLFFLARDHLQSQERYLFSPDRQDSLIKAEIYLDLKSIIRAGPDAGYQKARLRYQGYAKEWNETKIGVRVRGNFRRKHCDLPPLKVNFETTDLSPVQLLPIDRLKLVTNCRYSSSYQDYVLKEYLTYRLYNLLTPVSFRVRLIEITYFDTGRKEKAFTGIGFLLEDFDDLARRLSALPLKEATVLPSQTDRSQMDLMAIFAYMIGNPDWSVVAGHNTKLIQPSAKVLAPPLPVPYDFDMSGLVDASYAVPPSNLPINSVKERYYQGPCRSDSIWWETIQIFKDRKPEMLETIRSFTYLGIEERTAMILYLDAFLNDLEKPQRLTNRFRLSCQDP